ncbi:hypothetical protein [Maricaulis maris]|uniref:hypothetical protein n=1 Tax=Maricaulis maris TaxID=74318 RepID=UPI003B8C2E7A
MLLSTLLINSLVQAAAQSEVPNLHPDAVIADYIIADSCFDDADVVRVYLDHVVDQVTDGRAVRLHSPSRNGRYPAEFIMMTVAVAGAGRQCSAAISLQDAFTVDDDPAVALVDSSYIVAHIFERNDLSDLAEYVRAALGYRWNSPAIELSRLRGDARPLPDYAMPPRSVEARQANTASGPLDFPGQTVQHHPLVEPNEQD